MELTVQNAVAPTVREKVKIAITLMDPALTVVLMGFKGSCVMKVRIVHLNQYINFTIS